MSSKLIKDLAPQFQAVATELVKRCEAEIGPIVIIETHRTEREHQANLLRGVSWTKRSKHCDGLAIDLCPVILLKEKKWAPGSPLWQKMGVIAKNLGLRWGGDWEQKDMDHFEMTSKTPLLTV